MTLTPEQIAKTFRENVRVEHQYTPSDPDGFVITGIEEAAREIARQQGVGGEGETALGAPATQAAIDWAKAEADYCLSFCHTNGTKERGTMLRVLIAALLEANKQNAALEAAETALEKCAHILECLAEGTKEFHEEDGAYRKCPDCEGWVDHYGHAPQCQTVAYAKAARTALTQLRAAMGRGG